MLGVTTAKTVSTGNSHSCIMLSLGALQCTGNNSFGQLGNVGDLTLTPGAVVGANAVGILNVGVTMSPIFARDADKVFTWAEKNYPQFKPAGLASISTFGYRYRVYEGRYYLAVNEVNSPHVFYFDAFSMSQLLDVGLLSDFLTLISN